MTTSTTARMSTLHVMFVLGLLEAFGPLSMDMYLPQLPGLAEGIGTSDALAQATMSACMIGLGLGQLVAGPLSDRFGRRRPLFIGVAAFAVLSAVCAVAPTIEVLLAARFLQGLAGSAGIVISLAVARDLFSGSELSRMLSLLLLVSGTAPIVAPLIGGQLALVMDWRGIFWVLCGIGAALGALVIFGLPETLAHDERHAGGFGELRVHLGVVLRDRLFTAMLIATVASGIAFFAYLSMSSFVLEGELGLTPQLFSLVFALNALANIGGAQFSRLIVARFGPRAVFIASILAMGVATLGLLICVASGGGVVAITGWLILFMLFGGMSGPNGQALALAHHGPRAGTAAALLGTAGFTFGPIVVPLVALFGTTAWTMAVTIAVAAMVEVVLVWTLVRPASRDLSP